MRKNEVDLHYCDQSLSMHAKCESELERQIRTKREKMRKREKKQRWKKEMAMKTRRRRHR